MQSYLLLCSDDGNQVLVAKKKLTGKRFGGEVSPPTILNYAGQWVIPGGGVKTGEEVQDAAVREFLEETGLTIREGDEGNVKSIYTTILEDNSGSKFSCSFAIAKNQNRVSSLINQNLSENRTLDDELQIVEWVDVLTAKGRFQTFTEVIPEALSKAKQPRDWFVIALSFFVNNFHSIRPIRDLSMNNEVSQLRQVLGKIAELAGSVANPEPSNQTGSGSSSGSSRQIFRSPQTQIHAENYRLNVAPITFPDILALSDPTPPDPTAYKYDADTKEIQTCFVIGLSPDERSGMKGTYQDILDFVTMITGHANQKLYEKIKAGSIGKDDYMGQGDYRARLMQALILNTKGFLAADQLIALNKSIDTLTANLHTSIIKTLFAGIAMPETVIPMLEKTFDDLKGSILTLSKDSTVEGKHIFLILRYFEKNELGFSEAKIRLFLFKLKSEVTKITIGKSNFSHVKLEMDFASDQYIFNEKIYASVRDSFDQALIAAGKATISNYSNVDVEV